MAMTEEMDDLREGLVNMIEWLILATTRTKRYRHVADDDDEGDLDEVCVIASDPSPMSASVGTASSSTLKEIKCHLGQVLNTLTALGPWCAYKVSLKFQPVPQSQKPQEIFLAKCRDECTKFVYLSRHQSCC